MVFLFFLSAIIPTHRTYNIDTQSPLIIGGPLDPGSMFGYSVLLHLESDRKYVALVGAPRANTSQPLNRPGAVYKCPLSFGQSLTVFACSDWVSGFDNGGDETVSGDIENITKVRETKSGQYFGMTLLRTPNRVMGCAPLYKDHYKRKIYNTDQRLPIGRCITLSRDLDPKSRDILAPCLDVADSLDTYGACLAGSSATSTGEQVVIGTPSSNYGLGNAYNYEDNEIYEMKVDHLSSRDRSEVDYAGYSTVFCDINGDGEKELILGTPRAYNYRGSFRVYPGSNADNLELRQSFDFEPDENQEFPRFDPICPNGYLGCETPKGDHMGSYFGHTLACGDLNNDTIDDLVVAVPFFSEFLPGNMWVDRGKVVIYFGQKSGNNGPGDPVPDFAAMHQVVIMGDKESNSSLFGFSLNLEADLNNDGIKDLIVGAPYEKDVGAVYVFNGGNETFDLKHSQKIKGSDFPGADITTFGTSISSGFNVDRVGGDDVVIGTHKSNTVTVLRTFPIVEVKPQILLEHETVDLDKTTYLDEATGEQRAGNTVRLNISSEGITFQTETATLIYKLILDPEVTEEAEKRVYIRENGTALYEIEGKVELKSDSVTFVAKMYDIMLRREKIQNIHNLYIDVEGQLVSGREFNKKRALKHETFREARKLIKIETNCNKTTGTCLSNVGVTDLRVVSEEGYAALIIDKEQTINVKLRLRNKGEEDAHRVTLILSVPRSHRLDYYDKEFFSCQERAIAVECKASSPISPGAELDLAFVFLVNASELEPYKVEYYYATVRVDFPSQDKHPEDNTAQASIPTNYMADVRVVGAPRQARKKFDNRKEMPKTVTVDTIGPIIRHVVEIRIEEDSSKDLFNNIGFTVWWPSAIVYLYQFRVISSYNDNLQCKLKGKVDLNNLYQDGNKTGKMNWGHWKILQKPKNPAIFTEGGGTWVTDCSHAEPEGCEAFTCTIRSLQRGSNLQSHVRFEMAGRLKEHFLWDMKEVVVTSFIKITSVSEDILLPPSYLSTKAITSYFNISSKSPHRVSIFIIACSVGAGLLILAIIVYVLYRRGFFKTHRTIAPPPNFFQTGQRSETLPQQQYTAL